MLTQTSHVSALLGAAQNKSSNIFDLVTGKGIKDVTTAVLNDTYKSEVNYVQNTALTALRDFAEEFIEGKAGEKMISDIDAIEKLMAMSNESSFEDPVFSILAANPKVAAQLPAGTLLNGLI